MQPYREDPVAWDVLTHPYVRFTGQFSQYILPDPRLKIRDYYQNPDVEFDEQCLINKLGPNLPNAGDWNTFAIRCRVFVQLAGTVGGLTNQQLENLLSCPTNLGYSISVPVVGSGAFANNEFTSTATGSIIRNIVVTDSNGNERVEEVTDVFEVEQEMNPGFEGSPVIDLTFYSVRGSDWQAIAVRVA